MNKEYHEETPTLRPPVVEKTHHIRQYFPGKEGTGPTRTHHGISQHFVKRLSGGEGCKTAFHDCGKRQSSRSERGLNSLGEQLTRVSDKGPVRPRFHLRSDGQRIARPSESWKPASLLPACA